jgi:hypothetical protein
MRQKMHLPEKSPFLFINNEKVKVPEIVADAFNISFLKII